MKPDIALLGGGLAFRTNLINLIFPSSCSYLEFLPIQVSGEDWLVTNCLKTTNKYDRERSVFYRAGERGPIFLINHIVVQDPEISPCEIFVVEDSNRTTLLMVPDIVERIVKTELQGINFSEIGVLMPD